MVVNNANLSRNWLFLSLYKASTHDGRFVGLLYLDQVTSVVFENLFSGNAGQRVREIENRLNGLANVGLLGNLFNTPVD